MVLGQDLDSTNDSFEITQAFVGELANLVIYDELLNISDMNRFVKCNFQSFNKTPIYQFKNGVDSFIIKGPTVVYQEHKNSVCQKEKVVNIFFPNLYNFVEANYSCRKYGGFLAIPETVEENVELYKKYNKYYSVCPNSWSSLYWLGIKGNVSTGKWHKTSDNSIINYENFETGWSYPSDQRGCAVTGGPKYTYSWFSAPCDIELCTLCEFKNYPKLRIRGLCADSRIDETLFLFSQKNLEPLIIGIKSTLLFWNKTNWIFKSRYSEEFVAVMEINKPNDYPMGLHTWDIHGDKCQQGKVCRVFIF